MFQLSVETGMSPKWGTKLKEEDRTFWNGICNMGGEEQPTQISEEERAPGGMSVWEEKQKRWYNVFQPMKRDLYFWKTRCKLMSTTENTEQNK